MVCPSGAQQCSGLNVVQYDAEKLSHTLGHDFEWLAQHDETHLTPAKKTQKFSYFRFMRK